MKELCGLMPLVAENYKFRAAQLEAEKALEILRVEMAMMTDLLSRKQDEIARLRGESIDYQAVLAAGVKESNEIVRLREVTKNQKDEIAMLRTNAIIARLTTCSSELGGIYRCTQPAGHEGRHSGPVKVTVEGRSPIASWSPSVERCEAAYTAILSGGTTQDGTRCLLDAGHSGAHTTTPDLARCPHVYAQGSPDVWQCVKTAGHDGICLDR